LLTRRPDDDLYVLSRRSEKVHEAFHGKGSGAVQLFVILSAVAVRFANDNAVEGPYSSTQ